jgi:hypothetical protein
MGEKKKSTARKRINNRNDGPKERICGKLKKIKKKNVRKKLFLER